MAWVAFDRAIKSAEAFELDGPGRALARAAPTTIHAEVCARGFDPRARQLRAVLRLEGARREPAADADVGFLPPDDPRVRGTVAAIEQRLLVDGFVLRYDTADDRRRPAAGRGRLPGLQLLAGRRLLLLRPHGDEARALFERLLALRNDVGLLPRNTTRARGGWSATSRRRSRTSRWSTPRTT